MEAVGFGEGLGDIDDVTRRRWRCRFGSTALKWEKWRVAEVETGDWGRASRSQSRNVFRPDPEKR
jgi:hypothetical protein